MNRNKLFTIIAVATLFVGAFSCADNNATVENEVSYFETFDKWVAKNYPDIPKVEGKDGLYMRITKNSAGNTTKPTDSSYVSITYSSMAPDGNYLVNMDPIFARQLNTFSYSTRYVPFKFRLHNWGAYYGMTLAQYEALKMMSVGDEVEIVAAVNYGYYYGLETMYQGFKGNTSPTSGVASYIKMKLNSFVLDAKREAENQVNTYVDNNWSYVEDGLFMKKIIANDNVADSVRQDSVLKINYTGFFIDNFIFDTNIKSVAEENNIYSTDRTYVPSDYYYNKYDSTNFGATGSSSNFIHAFKGVIGKMRLGEKVTMICYPSLAYGAAGSYGTTGTLIYTQTPLLFDIEIIKKEEE